MQYKLKKFIAYEIKNLKTEQTIATFYEGDRLLFAPLHGNEGTLIISTKKSTLETDAEIKLIPLSFFKSIRFLLMLLLKKPSRNFLVYDSIYVTLRDNKQKKDFFQANRHFANYSINLDNKALRENAEIVRGISDQAIRVENTAGAKIAIVIHIYFKSTLVDFIPIIKNKLGIDVIITTPILDLSSYIIDLCAPEIMPKIYVYENMGRDVRPFLVLLENGILDNYHAVCKVHGKKSLHLPIQFFGDFMRRANLVDLIYKHNAIDNVIKRFQNSEIGLIGSRRFLLEADRKHDFSVVNNPYKNIIDQLSPENNQDVLDFFAGTMFWLKPESLSALKALSLSSRFDKEEGAVDLKLEHLVERLFNLAVKKNGFKVESI